MAVSTLAYASCSTSAGSTRRPPADAAQPRASSPSRSCWPLRFGGNEPAPRKAPVFRHAGSSQDDLSGLVRGKHKGAVGPGKPVAEGAGHRTGPWETRRENEWLPRAGGDVLRSLTASIRCG